MQIVDGVEVHILGVPGKGGLPHTEVKVGSVDSRDCNAILIHHSIQNGGQPIDIPFLHLGLGQSAFCVCLCVLYMHVCVQTSNHPVCPRHIEAG